MLIDSHCHLDRLDLTPYQGDLHQAIQAAFDAGVSHMLCVGIDLESFSAVRQLAESYANIFASVGVHPLHEESQAPDVATLVKLADHQKVIAIGETGLDYHYGKGDLSWQRDYFRTHLQAAREVGKPVIVHSRSAKEDTLKILREEQAGQAAGVLHCFTEDLDMAEQAIDLGFYISFSGIITFKNAGDLREVVKALPLERILIETDSPYLAPMPYRGKSNEPKYVEKVAECVADLKAVPVDEVKAVTSQNFFDLFTCANTN